MDQQSAIDRGIARFDTWWSGLSGRERWLIGGMAALLAGVVLIYGIIKPVQAARADAIADIRTYETLNARILAAGALTPGAQPLASGPPQAIIEQAATRGGITATVTPREGGATAVVADATYEALIAWIGDVQRTGGIGVIRADISRTATIGHVTATLEFAR